MKKIKFLILPFYILAMLAVLLTTIAGVMSLCLFLLIAMLFMICLIIAAYFEELLKC